MEISKLSKPNEWKYFAKGNANILFRYEGLNDLLKDKLLRLRLSKNENEYITTRELYDFIELKCKKLFSQQIIDTELVLITTDFSLRLQSKGHKLMESEQYGLLIPNILSGEYTEVPLSKYCTFYVGGRNENDPRDRIQSVILELKPKWLYDNDANYCRTCLLKQCKGLDRHFCALDLLYTETVGRGLSDLFSIFPKSLLDNIEVDNKIPLQKLMHDFFTSPGNIIEKLKEYQAIDGDNDLVQNLKSEQDVSEKLSFIMTLRDVGLFIVIKRHEVLQETRTSLNDFEVGHSNGFEQLSVACSIYDLDLKSKMKYKHWIAVEKELKEVYNSVNPRWRFCARKASIAGTTVTPKHD